MTIHPRYKLYDHMTTTHKAIIQYKVPLREVARGVAQERNERHPAWNEYHDAETNTMRIVLI